MSKVNEEDKPLKIKEKAVLNNYFLHFNGTRAWMQVHLMMRRVPAQMSLCMRERK